MVASIGVHSSKYHLIVEYQGAIEPANIYLKEVALAGHAG